MKKLKMVGIAALAACGLSMASVAPVGAHASLQLYGEHATPGGYGVVFVRIPHGCGGLATDTVTVSIPDGFASVRPQFIPGWTASTTRAGTTVTSVSWSGGSLKNSEFADFGISVRYPTTAGEYGMKVVQMCGTASVVWDGADLPMLNVSDNYAGMPAAVKASLKAGKLSMVVDAPTTHAGEAATIVVESAGSVIKRFGIKLDSRGDFIGSFAAKGKTAKGERYSISTSDRVLVILDGETVGGTSLGMSHSSKHGSGH
jgi:periplasmic copper chaperone A